MDPARHVLIDGLNLAPGGGAVVMERIAAALRRAGAAVTVLLSRDLPAGGALRVMVPAARGAARAQLWRHACLGGSARRLGADALLSFNLHSPVPLPQATCHINLVPHLPAHRRAAEVGLARAAMLPLYARRAFTRSAVNIFESAHLRDLAVPAGHARGAAVAPMGVDIAPPRPTRPVPHRLVCVTSGARHKRNALALEIFRRYRRERPGATLRMIGTPEAILASLGPKDRRAVEGDPAIVLTGRLGRRQLGAALSASWAMLAVSRLESFHMVALEAMAAGCPALGFEGGAFRESVGPDMPALAEGDVEGAVSALLALDRDRPRLSAAARAWARGLSAGPCADRIARLVLEGTA